MELIELMTMPFVPNHFLKPHWRISNVLLVCATIFLLYFFRKNIFNKKTIISLFLIGVISLLIYYPLIKDKTFFAYDETDTKYYYSIVRSIEFGSYDFTATTTSIGYLYILFDIFVLFKINNIFKTYNMIVILMFIIFFLLNSILYFCLRKRKYNTRDSLLIIITIVTNMIFLISLYKLKAVYFITFISIILMYFLLKRIEKNDSLLLNVIFIFHYMFGGAVRPEFFFYTLVFVYKFVLIKINSIKTSKNKKNRQMHKSILVVFIACFIIMTLMYSYAASGYTIIGYFKSNLLAVASNFNSEINALVIPIFFSIFYFCLGFIYKKTRIYAFSFFTLFVLQFNVYNFDIHLLIFYTLAFPIIFFYENVGKKIVYIAIILSLIFNVMVIAFANSPFIDGKYMLDFHKKMVENEAILFTPYPPIFFGFLFKGSIVEVYDIEKIYEIDRATTEYVIVSSDKANKLQATYFENLKLERVGPLSPHDLFTLLKAVDK